MRGAVLPELRPLLLAMAQHWNEFAERAERRKAALPAPREVDPAASP